MDAAPVLFLGSYLLVRNPESEKDSWTKEFAAKEDGLVQFVVFTATSVGFFPGYLIRALLIGIFAILANLRNGIRSFSDNVHDTYLEDNVTKPPRLVSGLPQDHFINAINLIRAFPLATPWGVGGAIGVCFLYLRGTSFASSSNRPHGFTCHCYAPFRFCKRRCLLQAVKRIRNLTGAVGMVFGTPAARKPYHP